MWDLTRLERAKKIRLLQKAAPTPEVGCGHQHGFPVFSTNSKVLEEFTDMTGTLIIVDEVSFG